MSLQRIGEKNSAGVINDFYRHLTEGMHKNNTLRQAKLYYLTGAPTELQSSKLLGGLVLFGD